MTPRRRGITLVEVMVATTIALMLFVVLWRTFSVGFKSFHSSTAHLEAMQVAQLVLEMVENDLHGLVLRTPDDLSLLANMDPRSTLEFHVARLNPSDDGPLAPAFTGEPILYDLTPVAGHPWSLFTRNGRTESNLRLTALQFQPVQAPSLDGQPHYYLRTTVTAVDGTGAKSLTLVGLTALDLLTRTKLGHRWNPNDNQYKEF